MAKKVAKKTTSKKTPKTPVQKKKSTGKKPAPMKTKSVVAEIVEDHNSNLPQNNDQHHDGDYLEVLPSRDNFEGSDTGFDEDPLENTANHDSDSSDSVKSLVPVITDKSVVSSDPLTQYLAEIRRYKVMTKEEEALVAKKYFENKDPEAAELLVKSNLRFVVKIAAEYSKFGSKMIDLIQEGNVGLMHAVREFNPYKGARLITYAVWWIRGYIQEYLMRQYSMVRIGTTQNQRKLFYQLQKEKDALEAMGIEPNIALISNRLGIPEDEVRDMSMRIMGRDVSLDKPVDAEGSTSLGDLQKDAHAEMLDDVMARQEELDILKEKLAELRPELNDKERIILDERLLADDPLTLQEIGEKYGTTREAVRQMETRILKKIRSKMMAEES